LESRTVDLADGPAALTIADPAGLVMQAAKGCSAPLPFGEVARANTYGDFWLEVRSRGLQYLQAM